jgi:ESCRT-II complex subunit VPS22
MKRGVGVSVVKNKKIESEKFELIGKKMHESKMSAVREVLTKFQTSLTEFAEKHKKRINSDPEFRQQFHKMCVSVGVGMIFIDLLNLETNISQYFIFHNVS